VGIISEKMVVWRLLPPIHPDITTDERFGRFERFRVTGNDQAWKVARRDGFSPNLGRTHRAGNAIAMLAQNLLPLE
jgi:hypothetical protein